MSGPLKNCYCNLPTALSTYVSMNIIPIIFLFMSEFSDDRLPLHLWVMDTRGMGTQSAQLRSKARSCITRLKAMTSLSKNAYNVYKCSLSKKEEFLILSRVLIDDSRASFPFKTQTLKGKLPLQYTLTKVQHHRPANGNRIWGVMCRQDVRRSAPTKPRQISLIPTQLVQNQRDGWPSRENGQKNTCLCGQNELSI